MTMQVMDHRWSTGQIQKGFGNHAQCEKGKCFLSNPRLNSASYSVGLAIVSEKKRKREKVLHNFLDQNFSMLDASPEPDYTNTSMY